MNLASCVCLLDSCFSAKPICPSISGWICRIHDLASLQFGVQAAMVVVRLVYRQVFQRLCNETKSTIMMTSSFIGRTDRKVIHHESLPDSSRICFCNPEERKAYPDEQKMAHTIGQLSLDRHRVLLSRRKHQPKCIWTDFVQWRFHNTDAYRLSNQCIREPVATTCVEKCFDLCRYSTETCRNTEEKSIGFGHLFRPNNWYIFVFGWCIHLSQDVIRQRLGYLKNTAFTASLFQTGLNARC